MPAPNIFIMERQARCLPHNIDDNYAIVARSDNYATLTTAKLLIKLPHPPAKDDSQAQETTA